MTTEAHEGLELVFSTFFSNPEGRARAMAYAATLGQRVASREDHTGVTLYSLEPFSARQMPTYVRAGSDVTAELRSLTAVADTVDVDLVAAGVATLLAAIGREPFVSATVGGVTRVRRGHRRDGERWWAVSVSWNDSRRWRFVTRSEATAVAFREAVGYALDRLA